jgi:outer membrane protein
MQQIRLVIPLLVGLILLPKLVSAQKNSDSLPVNISLNECVNYALSNQPRFRQSLIDQDITERTIRANLAGWLPQIRAEYNLQHYLKLPVSFFPNLSDPSGPRTPTTIGLANTSNLLFQADQVLYSNDVIFASKAARFSRLEAEQASKVTKIEVVVNVSKAFYDILLTQQQLKVLDENILRVGQLLKTAFSLYESGINDKIDYKRATISLNNAQSQKKSLQENLKVKNAYLKQLMGVPNEKELSIAFDTTGVEQTATIDTLQPLNYESRIEYQLLETQMHLQTLNTKFYQWGYLPTVSAFINYNFVYQNNTFSELYARNFPNSVAGLKVALPIFQGTRRIQNLQRAQLQVKRLELDIENTKNQLSTEYVQALGIYKSNWNEWKTQEVNLQIAREVYQTVKLQYDEGIRPYLDVITSEADLRTSQLNFLNALYNVLASKLDVQRSLGTINN